LEPGGFVVNLGQRLGRPQAKLNCPACPSAKFSLPAKLALTGHEIPRLQGAELLGNGGRGWDVRQG